jgi:hypothetical protein
VSYRSVIPVALFGLLLVSGCAILTDPAGKSIKPALDARKNAEETVVPGTLDDVYRKVVATADAAGWEVFRAFPEKHMVVYHQIPGAVDSTQVGVFCTENAQGILVQVASPSLFSRELAAKALFPRL